MGLVIVLGMNQSVFIAEEKFTVVEINDGSFSLQNKNDKFEIRADKNIEVMKDVRISAGFNRNGPMDDNLVKLVIMAQRHIPIVREKLLGY